MRTPEKMSSMLAVAMAFGLLLAYSPQISLAQQQRTMCISQFALANQACSVMPPVEEDPDDPSYMKLFAHSPESAKSGEHHHERRYEHEHSPRHGGGHGEHPRANTDCCRWLEEVENDCVCEALNRLPTFLTKPKHSYHLSVGKTCKFKFTCGGA